jgi:arginine/ornithine transport system permease protein
MIVDFNVIWDSLALYFGGVLVPLIILLISLAFGLALAISLGLMRVSKSPLVNFPAWLST